jgi:transcriptional regulator with XRE-family HTH domain
MTIGTKIRLKRTQMGYSQLYMAHKLKMAELTYRKIENDKTIPNADRLNKIAEVLGVKAEDLQQSGYIVINDDCKCENGGYLGLNVVHNHKSAPELENEVEKLKFVIQSKDVIIESKDQLIKELERSMSIMQDHLALIRKNEK